MDGMNWLNLDWDEGPYFQTKRFDRYNAVIDEMLEQGTAYKCYCSKERLEALREKQMENGEKPRYDGHCRDSQCSHTDDEPHVVRFRNPQEGSVIFDDKIRGPIEFSNQELDDLIIRRTDGSPTYNFCVVVDDWDMEITHVIRGEDHINNTPRQINILKALGAPVPEYAHVSMILGDDGKKLSKRHGAVGVMQYRDDGYLPQALLNYGASGLVPRRSGDLLHRRDERVLHAGSDQQICQRVQHREAAVAEPPLHQPYAGGRSGGASGMAR